MSNKSDGLNGTDMSADMETRAEALWDIRDCGRNLSEAETRFCDLNGRVEALKADIKAAEAERAQADAEVIAKEAEHTKAVVRYAKLWSEANGN